jgi:hypothetical protein
MQVSPFLIFNRSNSNCLFLLVYERLELTFKLRCLFWDVALCSLTETDCHFKCACCFHHQSNYVNQRLQDYMVQHSRSSLYLSHHNKPKSHLANLVPDAKENCSQRVRIQIHLQKSYYLPFKTIFNTNSMQ